MAASEIFIYGRSCNTLPCLVLSDSKFLDVSKTTLTVAKTMELEFSFPFIEAKTEDIEADLKGSSFLPGVI